MRKITRIHFVAVILLTVGVAFESGAVPSGKDSSSFLAAHLTDIHLREQLDSVTRFQAVVSQMRKENPDISIVLNTGDVVGGHNGKWKYWTDSVKKGMSDLPIYTLLGNHDFEADISDTKALCKLLKMPERYYAFDYKNWHFVMLDGNTIRDEKQVDEKQHEWLAQELKATPDKTPIAILTHQSIRRVKAITDVLALYPNVKLVLSGHTHLYRNKRDVGGITYISGGAVCGNWWDKETSADGKGSYKGTRPGYGLVRFYADGTFKYDYISHDH